MGCGGRQRGGENAVFQNEDVKTGYIYSEVIKKYKDLLKMFFLI